MKNGEINTGYRTYLRLLKYATPYWHIFFLGALAMLIYALTDTGFAYLIKTLTDNFAGTTDGAYIGAWKFSLPIAVIVIFIIRGISGFFSVASSLSLFGGLSSFCNFLGSTPPFASIKTL